MAKKGPPSFEERKAALQAANAPRKPITNEVPVEAPEPRKPAAPAKPVRPRPTRPPAGTVVKRSPTARPSGGATARPTGGAMARPAKPKGAFKPKNAPSKSVAPGITGPNTPRRIVQDALTPWHLRQPNAQQPWAGKPGGVRAYQKAAAQLHQRLQSGNIPPSQMLNEIEDVLGMTGTEASLFRDYAIQPDNRGQWNRIDKVTDFRQIEAATSEGMWQDLLEGSGRSTENLTALHPQYTDLRTDIDGAKRLIDVQQYTPGSESVRLGFLKKIKARNGFLGKEIWNAADPNDKVIDIIRRVEDNSTWAGRDKMLQGTEGIARHIAPDRIMRDEGHLYGKDYLVGGKISTDDITPSVPVKGYAADLSALRHNFDDATKGDIESIGGRISPKKQNLGIDLPASQIKRFGDGQNTLDMLISKDIQSAVKSKDGSFFGGIPINGQQARAGAKELAGNWKGAAGLSLLNGASREVGVKLGKGDYTGAATEAAGNYVAGAAIERGVKSAVTSNVGKRVLSGVAKRIPASLARFKAGTAASGGLLAPALAIATVVDVADGITEGVTGKGIYTHGREAGERAEATKQEARAAGASETDLRRAARRSQPIAVPTPVSEPVAVEPPVPTSKPSINPTRAKQIAGAWRRRRK